MASEDDWNKVLGYGAVLMACSLGWVVVASSTDLSEQPWWVVLAVMAPGSLLVAFYPWRAWLRCWRSLGDR